MKPGISIQRDVYKQGIIVYTGFLDGKEVHKLQYRIEDINDLDKYDEFAYEEMWKVVKKLQPDYK